jgi:hypothetical protein
LSQDIKRLRKRSQKAFQDRAHFDRILIDVYDYILPFRSHGNVVSGHVTPSTGAQLTDKLFDLTAPRSAYRFSGRMQTYLLPPWQDFFQLEAGPAIAKLMERDEQKRLDEELATISNQVHAALRTGSFHTAASEMCVDYYAGTGAMLMLEGDDADPIKCMSAPIFEIALERGPYGSEIWGRHWLREWPAWQIEQMWPNGKYSDEMKRMIKDEADKPVAIMQSTTWDPQKKRWKHCVYRHKPASAGSADEEPEIAEDEFRTSPWITPRFFVVPGEVMGRGPAMMMLPSVKTLNKARELDLKAAALALYGVWAYRDDGVFNPDTARFSPGAMWAVGATQGSGLGPSLQKLDVPGKYDLSRIIIEEEREQIRQAGMDRSLPPEAGAVRSPTEIVQRIKDHGEDLLNVLGRQSLEIVQPIAMRAIEILDNKKIIQAKLNIDQLTVGLRVVSPVIQAAHAAYAKNIVDYLQIIGSLFGPDAVPQATRMVKTIPDLGRMMGVKEEYIPSEAEVQAIQARIEDKAAQKLAQMMADNMPAGAAPPPVNGAIQ